ncbi:MAG TPA: DMT family transporter, partial [Ottowia sp.]|nr:DMT family transporter [Ottowia sp.]
MSSVSTRASFTAPALALVVNAFVWGTSWWPFRQLEARGLHPLWATVLIYAVAVLVILALRPRALGQLLRTPVLWILVLASGTTNAAFNWAVTLGDVVRVVLLFYLMPLWAVGLAWALLGERPHLAGLCRVVLGLAGVAIVLAPQGTGLPWPRALADWLALAGGFGFALTNVLLRRLHATPAPQRVLAMFGGGTIAAGAMAWAGGSLGSVPALPAPDAGWLLLGLGLSAAFLAGNVALQYGASRLAAHTTALVMLSEVVFASLSAVALGAARLDPQVLVGGALIV